MMAEFSIAKAGGGDRRSAMLMRMLGIYIAGSVGAIQLVDIVVSRLGLDGRVTVFAIVLGVTGLPVVAAASLMLSAASAERRLPRAYASAPPAVGATLQVPVPSDAVREQADRLAALPRRLELALSHLRIAEIHATEGSVDAARTHRAAFLEEAQRVCDELTGLIRGMTR